MNYGDLAHALKLATPTAWILDPKILKTSGIVAEVATEDINAITVIKAFTREEKKQLSRKEKAHHYSQAPLVTNDASFHNFIEVTRHHLDERYKERLKQAQLAFIAALTALIIGIILVFLGVACIFLVSLPLGAVTAASSSISSIVSALAFKFNKEANDRLDTVSRELSVLERVDLAMRYIGYISDTEKKDQAITDLTKQLYSRSRDT